MADEQIEVAAPVETAPARELPTRKEVIDSGWSAAEADSAEKRNLIRKEEKAPEPVKTEVAKTEPVKTEEPERRRSDDAPEIELTPEQLKNLPGGVRGLFGDLKRNRALKQQWQKDAEQARKERDDLKARLESLERGAKPAAIVGEEPTGDEDDDKPLTMRQIREMQRQAEEDRRKVSEETQSKARNLSEAHKSHEEIARAEYEDFDDAAKLADDLIKNLDKLIPEGPARKRVLHLWNQFTAAASRSHELGENDLTEADLAYDLGKLHPKYGKKASIGKESIDSEADTDGSQPEISPNKVNGDHTPEKLKRIEQNTQRRASSASLPAGSGKRTVTASEVTVAEFLRFSPTKRAEFREKYPADYARLRG